MSDAGTAMGTVVQSTIFVRNESAGKDALYEINEILQFYDTKILSWREKESEVAKINATAGNGSGYILEEWTGLEADLNKIREISENSSGALDVTIGPVTELWNLDYWAVENEEEFYPPTAEEIANLLQYTGFHEIKITEQRIYLPLQMKLDLGAVGKGIVCDKIGKYLQEQEEVEAAIITVGGSVVTYGNKPDGSTWNVAIVHPREKNSYLGSISLKGQHYVATSGDYERYVEKDGVRYHHIINPATGYPADSDICSVTIVSDSGLLSDALSTACFVLGSREGLKLAESYNAEALFVTKDLELIMTEGMKEIFKSAK